MAWGITHNKWDENTLGRKEAKSKLLPSYLLKKYLVWRFAISIVQPSASWLINNYLSSTILGHISTWTYFCLIFQTFIYLYHIHPLWAHSETPTSCWFLALANTGTSLCQHFHFSDINPWHYVQLLTYPIKLLKFITFDKNNFEQYKYYWWLTFICSFQRLLEYTVPRYCWPFEMVMIQFASH